MEINNKIIKIVNKCKDCGKDMGEVLLSDFDGSSPHSYCWSCMTLFQHFGKRWWKIDTNPNDSVHRIIKRQMEKDMKTKILNGERKKDGEIITQLEIIDTLKQEIVGFEFALKKKDYEISTLQLRLSESQNKYDEMHLKHHDIINLRDIEIRNKDAMIKGYQIEKVNIDVS